MKAESMAIRELAELCGVAETTVCRWAKKTKIQSIRRKLREAQQTQEAAQFNRQEVLAIIKKSNHQNFALLFVREYFPERSGR